MQKILDRIQSGELCLKELPKRQLPQLCAEIREFLIEHVSKQADICPPISARWS